jgi:hypothetical protein
MRSTHERLRAAGPARGSARHDRQGSDGMDSVANRRSIRQLQTEPLRHAPSRRARRRGKRPARPAMGDEAAGRRHHDLALRNSPSFVTGGVSERQSTWDRCAHRFRWTWERRRLVDAAAAGRSPRGPSTTPPLGRTASLRANHRRADRRPAHVRPLATRRRMGAATPAGRRLLAIRAPDARAPHRASGGTSRPDPRRARGQAIDKAGRRPR